MSKTAEVILPEPTRSEAEISSEISQFEALIRELYLERRGMPIAGSEDAWCCICGKRRVHPQQGEDICDRCTP